MATKIVLITIFLLQIFHISDAQHFYCNGNHQDSTANENILPSLIIPQQKKDRTTPYYIPVVVHVLYHTAAENISDADIYAQLAILNNDFARLNPDAINTPAEFIPVASSVSIQFCLAQKDSSGNPTTGITRTYTDTAMFMDNMFGNNQYYQPTTGGKKPWDPLHYLNIYVINRSYYSGTASFGVNGHGSQWDGIAIKYSEFNTSRTLTHEVGHYFGLYHIFGGTSGEVSCGDDQVADTPPQTFHYNCQYPMYSCGNTGVSDMVMNYMDYTSTSCKNMFTNGQSNRMVNILNTIRFPLLNTGNCGSVGLDENTSLKKDFKLYPNPSNSIIHLQSEQNMNETSLLIYNTAMQQVREIKNVSGFSMSFNRDNLPSGIYFVRLIKGNRAILSDKIIID